MINWGILVRNVFAALGIIALVCVGLLTLFVINGERKSESYVEEAEEFAFDAVTSIATDWDVNELIGRASQNLLTSVSREQFDSFAEFGLRDLGPLTEARPSVCSGFNLAMSIDGSEVARVRCITFTTHERGTAKFVLNLIHQSHEWKIDAYYAIGPILDFDGPSESDPFQQPERESITVSFSLRPPSILIAHKQASTIGIGTSNHRDIEVESVGH